ASLQAPLDGLVLFALLDIHDTFENKDEFLRVMEQLELFTQQFNSPALGPIVDMYRARRAVLLGENDQAVQIMDVVVEDLKSSFANLQTSDLLDSARSLQASTYRKAGNTDRALEITNQILLDNPGFTWGRLEQVETLVAKGFFEMAESEAETLRAAWSKADADYVMVQKLDQLEAQIAEADTGSAGP
ncbi:MAG: hypothetical protein AAGA23_21785, partial [Pseudomonadota bacterium]